MEIPILYKDSQLVICRKPAGVTAEDGGMPELLSPLCGGKRIFCVHRLDKDTEGLMVYALNGRTAAQLSEKFSSGAVEKEYLAVVSGTVEPSVGHMEDLLFHDTAKNKTYVVDRLRKGVKAAALDYETLAVNAEQNLSLVRVQLHSGRSHQIRVQFAHRKHPLAGDRKYGSAVKCPLALLSCRLRLQHPVNEKPLDFSAVPPDTFPWNLFPLK